MLHSNNLGQVSIEFMAYFGMLLLIFVAFSPVVFNQTMEVRKQSMAMESRRIATFVEREVNSAVRFGDGYTRRFTVPEKISNHEYNITIYNGTYGKVLEVEWSEGVENRQLIATKIGGYPKPGENNIENSDGLIIFS